MVWQLFWRRCARLLIALLLLVQCSFGFSSLAIAQSERPHPSEPAQNKTESAEQSSSQSHPRTQQKQTTASKLTYPNPPHPYNYDALRQYDEEVYGEKSPPRSNP
ncbi:MAG: hypothetical protein F6K04_01720 [Leptolyngbya sp. SIO4C5]|nr:hypothetical protein [Leptolyngbya sp. SIO4C5]